MLWFRRRGIPKDGINPPFTIVSRRADATAAGYFTPLAEVAFDRRLAASGLLSKLSAMETKTLIAVLANVNANGRIAATVRMVAKALGLPSPIAFARLTALSHRRWRGRPVIYRIDAVGGLAGYAPSPEIIGQRLGPLERDEPSRTVIGAGRNAVLRASRAAHARPRGEVEAEILRDNGGMLPEEYAAAEVASHETLPLLGDAERHVRERLIKHGVDRHVADALVRKHGRDRAARQIAYLPYRKNVKNVPKMLVTAIENDYERPATLPRVE